MVPPQPRLRLKRPYKAGRAFGLPVVLALDPPILPRPLKQAVNQLRGAAVQRAGRFTGWLRTIHGQAVLFAATFQVLPRNEYQQRGRLPGGSAWGGIPSRPVPCSAPSWLALAGPRSKDHSPCDAAPSAPADRAAACRVVPMAGFCVLENLPHRPARPLSSPRAAALDAHQRGTREITYQSSC
jgi:hypothetical protein